MLINCGERNSIFSKKLFTARSFLTKVTSEMTTPSRYGKKPRQARLDIALDRRFEECMKRLGMTESELLRHLIERGLLFEEYRGRDRKRKQEKRNAKPRVSDNSPGASHHRGASKDASTKVQSAGLPRKESRSVEGSQRKTA